MRPLNNNAHEYTTHEAAGTDKADNKQITDI
jgi:hypothetical protein